MAKTRSEQRNRRKMHIRKRVAGSVEKPRLSIFRSNRYMFAQIVDDENGKPMCGLWEKTLTSKKDEKPSDRAGRFGEEFGKLLKKRKVDTVVFDRGGYKYHGRIKQFADGVRKQGIKF